MSFESFLNHPLLIWEWLVWITVLAVLRLTISKVWKHGKKTGREEFDEYKKWEKVFKENKNG